jgi:predicted DNA-binding transcriptional regulator AlpA
MTNDQQKKDPAALARAEHARVCKNAPMPNFVPRSHRGRRLLLKRAVLDRVPLSYPAIWEKMRNGTFPRSVVVGAKVAWFEDEIDAWLAGLKRTVLKGDEEGA